MVQRRATGRTASECIYRVVYAQERRRTDVHLPFQCSPHPMCAQRTFQHLHHSFFFLLLSPLPIILVYPFPFIIPASHKAALRNVSPRLNPLGSQAAGDVARNVGDVAICTTA
jgi:hypothetical protein